VLAISLRRFGSSEPSNLFALALPKSRLLSGRIAIGVTPEQAEITITGYSIGARVLLLKHAAQNFFQLRRALAQRFASEITNAKSWPRLECPGRKFAMLIRANVSKSHRLFFLPWTSTSLLHGRSTTTRPPFFCKQKPASAAFIFRGQAPQSPIANENEISGSCASEFRNCRRPKSFLTGTGKLVRRRRV